MEKEQVFSVLKAEAAKEPFARLLGIEVIEVGEGRAVVEMDFSEEKGNIYRQAHGGAIFALLDEAFELASNSHGTVAVALNINVTYIAPPPAGARLRAEAKEISRTRRTATYQISVSASDRLIAICQAVVYRKDDPIPFKAE